jgi:hypothetical protein
VTPQGHPRSQLPGDTPGAFWPRILEQVASTSPAPISRWDQSIISVQPAFQDWASPKRSTPSSASPTEGTHTGRKRSASPLFFFLRPRLTLLKLGEFGN